MDEEHKRILEIRNRVKKEKELKNEENISLFKDVYKHLETIKNNKALLFCIIAVTLLGLTAVVYWGSETNKSKNVAENMLNEWKRGEDGIKYWNYTVDKSRLYNVKSYEHVLEKKIVTYETNGVPFADVIMHRFRIISTTKGGFPIEKIWNIYLFNDPNLGGWKVIDIHESE